MATDVATSFPDVILPPGATITVTMDDANAKITRLNVYGFSPAPDTSEPVEKFAPLFTYGAA